MHLSTFPVISHGEPGLVLAPMEGVTDAPMRALLSERGGFQFCVSEFLRISHELLPPHVYFRHIPELKDGCKTPSGTPVQIQLLGGNEERMALSAQRAFELGAKAIDINFGCPAPVVNRHDGGAAILKFPDRIKNIVSAVRKILPKEIPVSAKLRLGWESPEDIFLNARQAELGGASWITIHARTKFQGYVPPAHWKYIGEVRKRLEIPVVANGEIWTKDDFLKCQEETGCIHFMIGRGALGDPSLVHEMARLLKVPHFDQNESAEFKSQDDWRPVLLRFSELCHDLQKPAYSVARLKQFLRFPHMRKKIDWFDQIKRAQTVEEFFSLTESKIG